jgi:hypothetical protein
MNTEGINFKKISCLFLILHKGQSTEVSGLKSTGIKIPYHIMDDKHDPHILQKKRLQGHSH